MNAHIFLMESLWLVFLNNSSTDIFFSKIPPELPCPFWLLLAQMGQYISYMCIFTWSNFIFMKKEFNPYNAEATFVQNTKIFENHLNPVMLVFIR